MLDDDEEYGVNWTVVLIATIITAGVVLVTWLEQG